MSKIASEEDCFNCIGKVSHNASLLDMLLCNVFRITSGFDKQTAETIYYAPDATPVKFGLINRMLRVKQCTEEERDLINSIMESGKSAHTIRNEFAHSFLYKAPKKGLQRIRPRDKQSTKPFTEKYLQTSAADSMRYVLEAAHMYVQLCKKRGVSIELQF